MEILLLGCGGAPSAKIEQHVLRKVPYLGFLTITVPPPSRTEGFQKSFIVYLPKSLPFPLNMMNVAAGPCITSSGSLPDGEVFTVF